MKEERDLVEQTSKNKIHQNKGGKDVVRVVPPQTPLLLHPEKNVSYLWLLTSIAFPLACPPSPQEVSSDNADEARIFSCWQVILSALLQTTEWPGPAFQRRSLPRTSLR